MKNLIEILRQETKSLKEQYVEKTKEWASKKFDNLHEKSKYKDAQWCEYFGLVPVLRNVNSPSMQFMGFPNGFYNSKHAKTYQNIKTEISKAMNMGKEKYISESQLKAERHYDYSIEKLAYRIDKKGLDQNNLTVKTSHIGVNIETTLTDGKKTVRAFTIIASGEIQCPHYRYLIK